MNGIESVDCRSLTGVCVCVFLFVCVCVCVCARARVRACVRACVVVGGGVGTYITICVVKRTELNYLQYPKFSWSVSAERFFNAVLLRNALRVSSAHSARALYRQS